MFLDKKCVLDVLFFTVLSIPDPVEACMDVKQNDMHNYFSSVVN